jgi:hypothetical protein
MQYEEYGVKMQTELECFRMGCNDTFFFFFVATTGLL